MWMPSAQDAGGHVGDQSEHAEGHEVERPEFAHRLADLDLGQRAGDEQREPANQEKKNTTTTTTSAEIAKPAGPTSATAPIAAKNGPNQQ